MRIRILAAITATTLLMTQAARGADEKDRDFYRQLELFGDVFERVRADYVKKVGEEKLIESALNGMLTSLDPHSSYLNAKSFRDMQVQTRGEFGGLGIEVTMENGFVKVVSPIDDTPAFRAGLKPGDLITRLDNEAVQGMSLAAAVEKMRGRVNADLILIIRRAGTKPFEVTITRAVIASAKSLATSSRELSSICVTIPVGCSSSRSRCPMRFWIGEKSSRPGPAGPTTPSGSIPNRAISPRASRWSY